MFRLFAILKNIAQKINIIASNGVRLEQRTLLWTNPSPTQTRQEFTVQLDLSEYEEIEIDCYNNIQSSPFRHTYAKAKVGDPGIIWSVRRDSNTVCYPAARGFESNNSAIVFTTGGYLVGINNMNANAAYCVPYRIYGIRYITLGGGGTP